MVATTIFFEYRDVVKAATCFCGHDDYKWCSADICGKCEKKNRFELDFIEFQ